jgi:hypothetical protein
MSTPLPSRHLQKHVLTDAIGTRKDHNSMSGCASTKSSPTAEPVGKHRLTDCSAIQAVLQKHEHGLIGGPVHDCVVTWR